jgi:copper(I)-binding protein
MLSFVRFVRFVRLVAVGIALAFAASAYAQDYTKGSLSIDHPWSRATPHGAQVAGGYLMIENKGADADRLVSITSEIAGRVEIHEMTVQDGIMKMRPLLRGLEIKPGAIAKLEPGGFHVMFMNLKRPLKQGEKFKGTLVFEKAGPLEIEFKVEAMGAGPGRGH